MATKLETFLKENKINENRLISASRQLERLRPEDRAIKLKQAQARKSEDGKKAEGLEKPRSGRTVTSPGLARALRGDKVSGPMKTRILKAVNRVLEQRKKDEVTIDQLFEVPVQNPPKPKPAEGAEGEGGGEE
jgi:hypothetical protein